MLTCNHKHLRPSMHCMRKTSQHKQTEASVGQNQPAIATADRYFCRRHGEFSAWPMGWGEGVGYVGCSSRTLPATSAEACRDDDSCHERRSLPRVQKPATSAEACHECRSLPRVQKPATSAEACHECRSLPRVQLFVTSVG